MSEHNNGMKYGLVTETERYFISVFLNYPIDGMKICQKLMPYVGRMSRLLNELIPFAFEVYSHDSMAGISEFRSVAVLKSNHDLDFMLYTYCQVITGSALWEWHAEKLIEEIQKNDILNHVKKINEHDSLEEILAKVAGLSRFSAQKDSFFANIQKDIDEIKSGKASAFIPTGFDGLDKYIGGGLPLGDVVVVSGATGSGKSAFTLNIVYNVLKNERAVVTIYSLEMTAKTVIRRLASIHSGVDARFVGGCAHSQKSLDAFGRAFEKGILKIRSASTNLAQIRTQSVVDSKWNDKPNLILVDYTGLVSHKGKSSYERMSEISMELRQVALDSNASMLEVIQFSREYKKANDLHEEERLPVLSDLRDSGQIEQDASIVLMLHKPKTGQFGDYGEALEWQDRQVFVRKNRDGETDDFFPLHFKGRTFQFRSRSKD